MKSIANSFTKSLQRYQRILIASGTIEGVVGATTTGVFYTLLIKQLGVSDALTGTLSTVLHLGGVVQLFTIALVRHLRSAKRSTIFMLTAQHLLCSLLYLLPFMPWNNIVRIILFIIISIISSVLSSLNSPIKLNWTMAFVPAGQRGIFSSRKEIITLIVTVIYNILLSRVVDYYTSINRQEVGLMLCAVTIIILTVIHVITLLFTKDVPEVLAAAHEEPSLLHALKTSFTSPALLKLAVVGLTWNFFSFFCGSYNTVFLLQELSCSTTFIVIGSTFSNVIRVIVSTPFGHYADKKGFDHTLKLGFIFASVAFAILSFWRPANGQLLYLLYQIPFSCALTTLSNSLSNVTLQYIPPKELFASQGIYFAGNCLAAFLGSLAGGQILAQIQAAGNTFLGFSIYGQQILNLISSITVICLAFYVHKILQTMPRVDGIKN